MAAKKPSQGWTPGIVRRQGPLVSEAGSDEVSLDEVSSGQISSPDSFRRLSSERQSSRRKDLFPDKACSTTLSFSSFSSEQVE